jgi:anti-anti-sigma factor
MKARDSHSNPVRDVQWIDTTAVVRLAGDINIESAGSLQKAVQPILDRKPRRIVVDMAEVHYMDSSGIASLIKLWKSGIELRLAGLDQRVREVLEITRVDALFAIFPTVAAALE